MVDQYLSLNKHSRIKLDVDFPATWTLDNPLFEIRGNGWLYNKREAMNYDNPKGIVKVTASEVDGSRKKTFQVTVVPWSANRLMLEPVKRFDKRWNISVNNGVMYVSEIADPGLELFSSTDGLETLTKVCDLPTRQYGPNLLFTPNGTFIRGAQEIWKTTDMQNWTHSFTCGPGTSTVRHMFDYYHDNTTGITYIYTGEYQGDANYRCKVYRGAIHPDGSEVWDTILEFYSRNELLANPSLFPSCWHIHLVWVDKATGDVYVGTGDFNPECHILYSRNRGQTWGTMGTGGQEWRILSIWFTSVFIYWNMDSGGLNDSVFRIPRHFLNDRTVQQIDREKETVAKLSDGSHWYHIWARDDRDRNIVIMNTAIEGKRRDENTRVFAFREAETPDRNVETHEVLVTPSRDPSNPNIHYAMFWPYCQDADGYIYMTGRDVSPETTWKFRWRRLPKQFAYDFVDTEKFTWIN